MKEIVRRVIQSRAGGAVERAHTLRHHGSYSNASHSWGVAMLMYYLWPEDFPRLAAHCLSHDVSEAWLGDTPAPSPRGLDSTLWAIEANINRGLGLPAWDSLPSEDRVKIKACDKLEFYIWAREQRDMGNRFIVDALDDICVCLENTYLPDPAKQFWEELKDAPIRPKQHEVLKEAINACE